MTPGRSSRAAWVGILVCALSASFSLRVLGQDANWQNKWDPGVRDKWFKDDKTDPKNPKHKLAPVCPDCQKEADKLQAALDDWYLLQFLDGEQIRKDGLAKQDGDQQAAGNACKANALAGLGLSEKEVKEKLKPPKKGEPPKPPLPDKKTAKAKIDELAKKLQECLDECNKPKEITPTPTPTPTPDDGKQPGTGETEKPPELPTPIKLPAPPKCFNTEAERKAFIDKWQPIANDQGVEARKAREIYNLKDAKAKAEPWGVYWQKKEAIHKASADALQKIIDDADDKTKTPVPCPTPTPTPSGGGKGKTPTPKPGKPKKAPRVTTGGNVSYGGGPTEDFCAQISDNKIKVDITGTGETIGRIADARVSNLTDEPIAFTIPPTVLESRSGKNQNYGVPQSTDVTLKPHEAKTIPLYGVCLNRNRPPVGEGISDDLAFNDCDPDPRIEQDDSDRMLRIAETVYEAADKLEEEGKLKDIPYKDPNKRKDIVKQWATWIRMSEITGDPPPTEDDLKKVVEKQVGKVPPDKQKKIDEGIDTIFDKIELTTGKAKDLDQPEPEEETTPAIPSGTGENVSNDTPTPAPQTQEKKKKEGKKKDKKKKYPPDIQKWVDAMEEYDKLDSDRLRKEYDYKQALKKWALENNKYYKELSDAVEKAKQKIKDASKNGGKPTQEDFDNLKKAQAELEKFEKEVAKDFQKTETGKGYFKEFADAEDLANRQKARADEAGKNIDPEVKKEILEKQRD